MKLSIAILALLLVTPAYAQIDPSSAAAFSASCAAAADVIAGKRPAADSEDAAKQLRQAAICFNAVTAIYNLEAWLKPEFSACPPAGIKPSVASMVPIIVAYLKSHPEQLRNNFHQTAVTAIAAAWPCAASETAPDKPRQK